MCPETFLTLDHSNKRRENPSRTFKRQKVCGDGNQRQRRVRRFPARLCRP